MQEISSVAVLGTGLMGRPMAERLLGARFSLRVWNRTRAKAEPLTELGARLCETPGEAVEDADVIITMLENGPVVTDVLFASDLLSKSAPGALVIDMSSIPPSLARDHATRLAERDLSHLDAPVSGGTAGAAAGTLAIMAGGSPEDFAKAAPLFEAMGRATHVGPTGAGQMTKLANQAIVAVTIAAVSEGLLLAAAGGADPAAVRDAISGGFCDSRILELHGKRMIDRDWIPGGKSSTHLKDMNTVLETAETLKLDLPLTKAVRDQLAELVATDKAETDHAALLLWLEARNAPHRVGNLPDRLPA
ncbi:NAD(P)-dependent oxidoreductase [Algihabitans albus]|uniref:NAD(P)-dependent oxidoreductase n=1 Tax=Algihabitans albus TaxID=2164067 RepID=UPI000E5C6574|nr:NAD(P)-dependent oxidoreductase [Algihabitans albus]